MTEAGILLESGNDKCLPLGTLRAVLQDHLSQLPVICILTGWEVLLPTAPPFPSSHSSPIQNEVLAQVTSGLAPKAVK